MSVHIGEMTSTIVPQREPSPPVAGSAEGPRWEAVEQLRRARARLTILAQRTGAEGYDD